MVLSALFKPRSIALSETVAAVKARKKLTVFLSLVGDSESSAAVKWFRREIFDYKWESYLYPDRANSTARRRSSILSVSAPTKTELLERVNKLLGNAPEALEVSVLKDPLSVAESCSQVLALGAQKEGGLR